MSTPPKYTNTPTDTSNKSRRFNMLAILAGVGLAIVLIFLLFSNFRSEKQRVDNPHVDSTDMVKPQPRTQSPDAEAPSSPANP